MYAIRSYYEYYFTASYPAYDRILLRSAQTLDALAGAEEVEVWHKHETGMMSKNVWAPELHYLDGRWFLYFAAGEAEEQWKIRPYVLECAGQDPLRDTWIERGPMKAADADEFSFRAFSLDATIFESDGKRYYVWAEKVGVGKMISNLYIAEMESPYKLKTVQVLLTTPDYDWERVMYWVDEGPAVLKRNGNIYLTFSSSGTRITSYNVCYTKLLRYKNFDVLFTGDVQADGEKSSVTFYQDLAEYDSSYNENVIEVIKVSPWPWQPSFFSATLVGSIPSSAAT